MDNLYLLDLINEANSRGGGMVLSLQDQPAVVVLTVEKYNQLISNNKLSDSAKASPDGQISNSQAVPWQMPQTGSRQNQAKVLVTGGAGYIGAHLVNELVKAGYGVTVLDNLSTGRRENISDKAIFLEGDLGDENLLKDIFVSNNFDAVFHMAASLEVEESVREPEKYLQNNVGNTIKLLNAMREANVKKIIFSSTAAVYGEQNQNPIAESSPLKPNNPYGSSKLLAERAIKYFCEYSGFQAVVFRYFNACGSDPEIKVESLHQSHLVHNVLQVAAGNKPVLRVFGEDYSTFDGTCIRDYVHVLDIAKPHVLALEKMPQLGNFEIFNIGTGKGFSVLQIANAAAESLNKIIPMEMAPRRAGDAQETVADNTKLATLLNYSPSFSSLENIIVTAWGAMKDKA